ncbi:arginine--tRNA ligase, partial [Candidatus Bathyarchaeota archaeon]|nr:arginine--tRNA ligase [Candidatus Bathyarchaeota archaeon]
MSQPTKGLQHDEPFKRVQDVIRARLVDILGTMGVENPEISFEIPPDPKFGDLSSPTCMGLARVLKQNPRQIATSVKEEFDRDIPSLVYKLEIAGPGYLNFFLKWDSYITLTREAIIGHGKKFGEIDDGAGKKVIVEHTSANPNKPIHLGTARCAVLGDIAGRVLAMGGYNVEIDNYIDDLGRQVAVMLHGYRHFKDTIEREPGQKDDYFLGLIY